MPAVSYEQTPPQRRRTSSVTLSRPCLSVKQNLAADHTFAPPRTPGPGLHDPGYVGKTNPRNPVLSPVFATLHGLPPTLFLTSERDMLLSGTTVLDRAFLRAGDRTQLIVFEGLPHAFWNDISLPESREAYGYMAGFFSEHLQ